MIRVLIIDEVPLICDILASIFDEETDIEVSGCATTLKEALEHGENCDVALVSTTMSDDFVLKLIESLNKLDESPKVIAIGMDEAEATILKYIEAGIAGYVLREESVEEVLETIRAVPNGEANVSPQVAAALMERVAELRELCVDEGVDPDSLDSLTRREREVLALLQQKLTNQEIADRLVIEVGTVKNHVHKILQKLNLNSRRDIGTHLALLEGNGNGSQTSNKSAKVEN